LTPLKGLLATRASVALLIVFVGFLGPLFEELAFRGFLMPLLVRSLGAVSGIVFTALLFALLHGPEYEWSWRHVTLILLAGVVFGSVRYVTRSTTAAVMIHSSYNLTFLIAFISQSGAIPAQW
jgi:membrane protease YdiL (CAAX protease family)